VVGLGVKFHSTVSMEVETMTLQEQLVVRTLAQVFDAIDVEEMRWDEPCAVQKRCELCDHVHTGDCLVAAGAVAGITL
jgi:hypothetical protein